MPVKTNTVAYAARDDFFATAINVDAHDHTKLIIGCFTGVARRTDRYVELSVRAESHRVRIVSCFIGQAINHHHRACWIVERFFDVVEAHDARSIGDIQRAITKSHAAGIGQAFDHHALLRDRAAIHGQRVNIARHAANKQRAFRAHHHVARLGHVGRKHAHPITRRRFKACKLNAFVLISPILQRRAARRQYGYCQTKHQYQCAI